MRPPLLAEPLAAALFYGSLAVWLALEVRQAFNRRSGATQADRGSLLVLRLSIAAGALLAGFAPRAHGLDYPLTPGVVALSLCLIWAGVALRWWSFRTLGAYFTFTVMTSPTQPVIASGPYRLLRHPSYAGLLLVLAGIAVNFGNVLSLAAFLVLPLIGFAIRMHVEETALLRTLGAAYASYASSRKRIIPFVW